MHRSRAGSSVSRLEVASSIFDQRALVLLWGRAHCRRRAIHTVYRSRRVKQQRSTAKYGIGVFCVALAARSGGGRGKDHGNQRTDWRTDELSSAPAQLASDSDVSTRGRRQASCQPEAVKTGTRGRGSGGVESRVPGSRPAARSLPAVRTNSRCLRFLLRDGRDLGNERLERLLHWKTSMQLSASESTASLLVLESGATFPFEATGYRGALDTAVVVQQHGESQASFEGRIRRTARQLAQAGVPLATVALVVDQHSGHDHPERHDTVLALIEQLRHDDGTELLLVADGAKRPLRHELMTLVGTLIERDGVKYPIAIDFDARHMAELRAARAPTMVRSVPGRADTTSAHVG